MATKADYDRAAMIEALRPRPENVFTCELVLPPTMNDILKMSKLAYAKNKKMWTATINQTLRNNNCPVFDSHVYCDILFLLKNPARDQDNTLAMQKFLMDALGKRPKGNQGEWKQFIIDDSLKYVHYPTFGWIQSDRDAAIVSLSPEPLAVVIRWNGA